MPLRVSGKNINIGDALRTHVMERLRAATAKYSDGGEPRGHVTITPEGAGYRADCSLHLPAGVVLQADGRAHEPYACFDHAADRIENRLRRYKRRLKGRQGSASDGGGEVFASYVLEAPNQDEDAPEDFSPAVIAESTARLRRMSVSAAVLDLDLTGAPIVVFRHAGTGRVNIVYRRSDENIGWIDAPSE